MRLGSVHTSCRRDGIAAMRFAERPNICGVPRARRIAHRSARERNGDPTRTNAKQRARRAMGAGNHRACQALLLRRPRAVEWSWTEHRDGIAAMEVYPSLRVSRAQCCSIAMLSGVGGPCGAPQSCPFLAIVVGPPL